MQGSAQRTQCMCVFAPEICSLAPGCKLSVVPPLAPCYEVVWRRQVGNSAARLLQLVLPCCCCCLLHRDSLQKRFKAQQIPFPGTQLHDDARKASLKLARAYVAEVLQVGKQDSFLLSSLGGTLLTDSTGSGSQMRHTLTAL